MKRCPTCGLTLDDSLAFCTNDGTPLPAPERRAYDPQATLLVSSGDMPTTPPAQPTGLQPPARPTQGPAQFAAQPVYQPQQQVGPPRPGKFIPALVGGAVAGLLSMLANFLPASAFVIFSFFCIVWAMIGGAITSRLYIKRSAAPVRQGEGAVVGLVAGAIAGVIYLAIDTPIAYAIHGDYIDMAASMQPERITAGAFFAMTGIFGALVIFGTSVVGGIIGVAMFEKRKGYHQSVPPPAPPGFAAPPGTYR